MSKLITMLLAAVLLLAAAPAYAETDTAGHTTDTITSSTRVTNPGTTPAPRPTTTTTTTEAKATAPAGGVTDEQYSPKYRESAPGAPETTTSTTLAAKKRRSGAVPGAGEAHSTTSTTEEREQTRVVVKGERVENPAVSKKRKPFNLGIDLKPYLGMAILLALGIMTSSRKMSLAPKNGANKILGRKVDIR